MKKLDTELYKDDLPDTGSFDWVIAKLVGSSTGHMENAEMIGVLLHDGCLAMYGWHFSADEFEVLDYDPNGNHSFWKVKFDELTDDDIAFYLNGSDGSDRFSQLEFVITNTVPRNRGNRLLIIYDNNDK